MTTMSAWLRNECPRWKIKETMDNFYVRYKVLNIIYDSEELAYEL